MSSRNTLDLNSLKQFEPLEAPRPVEKEVIDNIPDGWVSREPQPRQATTPAPAPVREGNVYIRAPEDVLERFKRLCKDDRRTYGDMLAILMDRFEGK